MKDSRLNELAEDYKKALEISVKTHEIHFCAYHFVCYSGMIKTLCLNAPNRNMSVEEVIHSDAMRISLLSVKLLETKLKALGRKDVNCLIELCNDASQYVHTWGREWHISGTVHPVCLFHVAAVLVNKMVKKLLLDDVCIYREIGLDEATLRLGKELDPPLNLDDDSPENAIGVLRIHFRRVAILQ